jgi:hypothetical protein
LAIFLRKKEDLFSWCRGEILARGKNGGKRIGKNKGVHLIKKSPKFSVLF